MTTTLSVRDVWTLVYEAAYEADLEPDVALRTNYSGRCMYGATCLALVGTSEDLVRFVVALTRAVTRLEDDVRVDLYQLGIKLLEALGHDTRQDNLGRDVVYYWPSVGSTS